MSQLKRAVKRARKRLKQIGLDVEIVMEGKTGYLIIPVEEMAKLIDRRIGWKNHKVYITEDKIVVEVWID